MKIRARLRRTLCFAIAIIAVSPPACGGVQDTPAPGGTAPIDPGDAVPVTLSLVAPFVPLNLGQTFAMRVVAYNARQNEVLAPPATWSSTNTLVATIDTAGLLRAVGAGTTTIIAQAGQLSGAAQVTVRPQALALVIIPAGEFGDTIQLAPGQTLQLSGVEYDRNVLQVVQPGPGSTSSWGSTRPAVATVSSSGFVTPLAEGDADIDFTLNELTAHRTLRVRRTPGSATVRFVNPNNRSLTFRANNGESVVSLADGEVHTEMMTAGTLFARVDEFQIASPPWCPCFDGATPPQEFLGVLPADSRLTLVPTSVSSMGNTLAPLWDWKGPISKDSTMVRVFIASSGANVYFTNPGAPMSVPLLQGCYLDWPYGVTEFRAVPAQAFDIVFQSGKGLNGPEAARFSVSPQAGTATTYVFTGDSPQSLKLFTLVDRP